MTHRALLAVPGVLLAAAATGCGGQTTIVKTVAAPATQPAKPASAAGAETQALLGDLLAVDARNTTLKVRVTRVIDPLPVGEFDAPDSGNRFVGVEVAVKNVGDHAYSDALANGAALVLKGDEQADSTLVSGGPCGNGFGSDVKIAAGDKRVGCIAFEVPAHKRLRAFQLTPDSGFADQTAQWRLPSIKPTGTTTSTTAASATSQDASPVASASTAPASPRFTSCDANISALAGTTTCGFAQNVFYEYFVSGQSETLTVYSPATASTYRTFCTPGEGWVVCDTSDGASVKFPQSAVDAYSRSQADRYAATHAV